MPILDFRIDGLLPDGVHEATWEEIRARYGWNPTRVEILTKLELVVQHFKQAGCRSMHIDGSFITNKEEPGDFDACWDNTGVRADLIAPILLDQSRKGRDAIWHKYSGDIKPDMAEARRLLLRHGWSLRYQVSSLI